MFDCGVCGKKDLSKQEVIVLHLTEAEKALARKSGKAPDEYVYCKPCHRILQTPLAGAELIKGTLVVNLKAAGVPNAEEMADKYFRFLLKRAAPEPLS